MQDAKVSMSSKPFPRATKTSASDWARGQLDVRVFRYKYDYKILTKE
jgi:hypothetical protein